MNHTEQISDIPFVRECIEKARAQDNPAWAIAAALFAIHDKLWNISINMPLDEAPREAGQAIADAIRQFAAATRGCE